ncbi:MAG TPA: bifunctional phosphopantothenoylcysteine decarboxylase/phosphopantothenate--cysteine ligase CoaBC [Longilinea sp.]|nr:bifunctional phosphopantothenoylcysteine decarboxylase/phosphopantothenate--cysteine ligase CoaBC [Longilinea sp.]
MTNPFENQHIVLGVTGSIAIYKAVDLASKLTQSGAVVDVVLTPSAEKFVCPITFQSVTGRKCYTDQDLWGGEGHVVHVGLGHAATLLLIAPASANTIAKLAAGLADNLLTATSLVADCPILIAPAMESHMYTHTATQANIQTLKGRGVKFIGPTEGRLASGAVGYGRFVEPPDILSAVRYELSRSAPLHGHKVVVTAGGTQEAIDPVRMITNRSSGKQGYAVAQAALDQGAEVVLISAPTALIPPYGSKLIEVTSASEMQSAVIKEIPGTTALIMAAAVADFKPQTTAQQKIKKGSSSLDLHLEPTTDILKEVASQKEKSGFPKITFGFAAESQDLLANATKKLQEKKLDMIIANNISASDAGFEVDTNRVTFLFSSGEKEELPLLTKIEVAEKAVSILIKELVSKKQ